MLSVVHGDGDVDDDFAVRLLQYAPQAFIELQLFGSLIEAGGLLLPGIFFLFQQC